MPIKTIPLSRLEENLRETLSECANTGEAVVVELPDHRMVSIRAYGSSDDEGDSLIDNLVQSNSEFQQLITKSQAAPRKPFGA